MTKTKLIFALVALTVVTACGTVKGVASDTYSVGKFVARQFSND